MSEIENPNKIAVTKEEIIQQIAKTLLDRRQARHVSLQAVSQRLKIRVPLLEAIETGRWEDLPGDIYIRGFVIRYGQYLGLDGNNLIEPYLQYNIKQDSKQQASGGESVWSEGTKTSWLWISIVIIVFIVLIKFLKPSVSRPVNPSQELIKVIEHHPVSTGTVQITSKPVVEEHALEIITPYQLWLKITTPIKVFEGFIPEGSTWTMKSEGPFQIRLGHTREVLLKFDGRQVPFDRQKSITLPNEP